MYKDYTLVFDIDGTLCPIKDSETDYADLVPFADIVEKLRACKKDGAKIVLYSSRNMNSYNGNIGLINHYTAPVLFEWLKKWNIPYDEIVFGKIWPGQKGFYIDDRTIRPKEFLEHSVDELEEICRASRCQPETKKLEIVITMGGLGSRFKKVGYTVPKYMIKAKGKTLFEWSLLSLKDFDKVAAEYIFIARNEDGIDVKGFITEECNMLGIKNFHIELLDYQTDGQATTAMLGAKFWNENNALLVYNIDTYVEPYEMKFSDLHGDGFIPCFNAEGEHWSFVKLNESGEAVEIKEKVRISDNCTVGAYYFKTCSLYVQLYNEFYSDEAVLKDIANGEKYIAPLYNYLLSKGGKVYISKLDPARVHVLGTPEELDAFVKVE